MPELVVVVGLQGCGKSTWVQQHLAATHAVVSKDHWPNARRREARQSRVVAQLLAEGRDVVVDGTNVRREDRLALVALAREAGVPVRAVWVHAPFADCLRRNAAREGPARVPEHAVRATRRRFEEPSVDEGFTRVDVVRPGSGAPMTNPDEQQHSSEVPGVGGTEADHDLGGDIGGGGESTRGGGGLGPAEVRAAEQTSREAGQG